LVNKQFEKLFHVRQEEVVGRKDAEIFSGEMAGAFTKTDSEVRKNLQTVYAEEEFSANSHGTSCYLTVKFPLTDEEGNVHSICGIATDITKRKKLETTLKEKEQLLRTIINNMVEGVVVGSPDGKFLLFNKRAEEILGGHPSEDLKLEMPKAQMFYPDGVTPLPPEDRGLTKALKGMAVDNYEMLLRHADFSGDRYLNVNARPIRDSEGNVIAGVSVFRDITARKKAEHEIKNANKFLNTILENIPDMIFVKDAEELRFVRFNKAGENLLGHSRLDLIGKNDYDFFPKEQADSFTQKDREVLSKKILVDIPEEPIDTPNGRRWLHTKKITIADDVGKPIYLMGISEDITERKIAGETRVQSEQLMKAIDTAMANAIIKLGDTSEAKHLEKLLADIREQYQLLKNSSVHGKTGND
jgi:PAS domain S-box-containing protein